MLIQARGLRKTYIRARQTVDAVRNADICANSGDFICITGYSGSGKSTLLNMLAGLALPSEGSIYFEDEDFTGFTDDKRARLRNDKIAYIPQGRSVLANLSVLDNICFPCELYKKAEDKTEYINELLARVGIAHLAERFPSELSGGEIRRLTIVRALAVRPLLIIADEPTGDLDPKNAENIMRLFHETAACGIAVIIATHDRENLRYASRILTMENGYLK